MRMILSPPSPARARRFSGDLLATLLLIAVSAVFTAALDVPRVRSDGFAYYIWLEALVRDHTVDLAAAAHHYASFVTYQVNVDPRTSRVATPFAFGSAVFWSPFYALSRLLDPIRGLGFHARDAAYLTTQGDTFLHSVAVAFGTWVYVTIALVLSFRLARRLVGVTSALFVVLATFFGTPLYYYTTIEPTMSHGTATFAVTLVVWLLAGTEVLPLGQSRVPPVDAKGTGARGLRYWFAVGLAVGLAGLVRWQLILLAVPIELALLARGRVRSVAACALGSAVLFSAVPLIWWYQYGSPNPAAVGTTHGLLLSAFANVLISPVSGMFAWAPLTILGIVGVIGLGITGSRRVAVMLLTFLLLEVLASALAGNGTDGASFGQRRMTEAYPIFVIGLAWLLQRGGLSSTTGRLIYLAIPACTGFTGVLFLTYIRALVDPATGTVIEAILLWLPPHTSASFAAIRTIHVFGFGSY